VHLLLTLNTELKEGKDKSSIIFNEESISPNGLEEKITTTEHQSIRIYSRIFQLHNHIVYDRFDQALACEKEILTAMNVTLGTVLGPFFLYLRTILHFRLAPSQVTSKKTAKKLAKKALKELSLLESHCASNFAHWTATIRAIKLALDDKHQMAQLEFDKAIDNAKLESITHEVALVNLLCSDFNQDIGNKKISQFYLRESIGSYTTWGAQGVVNYLSPKLQVQLSSSPSSILTTTSFDQESIARLSEAISSEIDYKKLIQTLMNVFTQNAGAEKAVLILKDEEEWFIEAEQKKDEVARIRRERIFGETNESFLTTVPTSICQYILRTKKTLILNDAIEDERFGRSEYVKQFKPHSILCMPLIKKGEMTGIVYLENNVMSGAFNQTRVQLLNYLSSQVAVSIDNAKLYSNLSKLNRAYERFVPKEFLLLLGKKSITEVNLGDQSQMNMTVLFSDIRNFTGMSEKMNPAENFQFINDYLSRMVPIIRRYNGFVDKYVGDEIMALFPTNADDAVQCGIAMMHELRIFGDTLRKKGLDPIRIGIGMNTGNLMLGTVGGVDRMNSTVISDAVNLASRVEKSTKETGAAFMITKETYDNLNDPTRYDLRSMGKKMYRGKSKYTTVFEIFESDAPEMVKLKKETFLEFESAVNHFDKREFKNAQKLFDRILEKNPQDSAARVFLKRIKEFSAPNQHTNPQKLN